MKQRSILILALLIAFGAVGLRGQDPDEGAGRGRPRTAYRPSVPGVHGLVTAGHPLAAIAGLHVLMKGGNAFDAAMAVGATLNNDGAADERHRRQRLHDPLVRLKPDTTEINFVVSGFSRTVAGPPQGGHYGCVKHL